MSSAGRLTYLLLLQYSSLGQPYAASDTPAMGSVPCPFIHRRKTRGSSRWRPEIDLIEATELVTCCSGYESGVPPAGSMSCKPQRRSRAKWVTDFEETQCLPWWP